MSATAEPLSAEKENSDPVTNNEESDEESDEELDPALEKILQSAWNKVVDVIEKEIPKDFLIFEIGNPFTKDTKPEEITREHFMKTKHLIIPKNVCDYAINFANEINEFKYKWPYGDTSCNNHVWRQFMFPEMKKVQTFLKKEKWRDALGSLFGMYLFDHYDGGHWIHDQEEYLEMATFSGWFRKYCSSWKKLLERSDDELGLKCAGGLPEGYRENLLYILGKQQDNLNDNILETFDEFSSRKIRINIISSKPVQTKVQKKSDSSEGPSSKKKKK